MIPLAKSLRPDQHRDLEEKEAAEQRAAKAPAQPRLLIVAGLNGFVLQFGLERTHRFASEWLRDNRPQLVAKSKANKPLAAAEALFRKEEA